MASRFFENIGNWIFTKKFMKSAWFLAVGLLVLGVASFIARIVLDAYAAR